MKGLLQRILGRQSQSATPVTLDFDFHGIGYPKTGNTWTRFMLGRYIQLVHGLDALPLFDPAEMQSLRDAGYQGPTGTFTHGELTWDTQTADDLDYSSVIAPYLDKKVLFLARHPLDTAVSHFMHMKYKLVQPYPGQLVDFMGDRVFGLEKMFRFYQLWAEHNSQVQGFMLLRYEDMRARPCEELKRVLDFLGQPISEPDVQDAVRFASFDNLKALEASGQRVVYQSSGFDVFGARQEDNPNSFHVRKGEVAGYKREFSNEACAVFEGQVNKHMPEIFQYS